MKNNSMLETDFARLGPLPPDRRRRDVRPPRLPLPRGRREGRALPGLRGPSAGRHTEERVVTSGQWSVASGQWLVTSGQWLVGSGQWLVAPNNLVNGKDARPTCFCKAREAPAARVNSHLDFQFVCQRFRKRVFLEEHGEVDWHVLYLALL